MPKTPSDTPRELLALGQSVMEQVATGEDLASAMKLLCQGVQDMAPGVVATILAVNNGRLYPLAAPSMPLAYNQTLVGMLMGPSAGSCGTAAWRGEPVEVHDIRTDPLWRDFQSLPMPGHLRACWSTPIKSRAGDVIGTFAFYYPEKRGPTELETQIVATCIHLCAVAIESDIARAETRRLVYLDTVTGLHNRYAFQERAAAALAASAAGGEAVAVHVIDVDEFKSINDTLGHDVGDLLLKAIGQRLRTVVQVADGEVTRLGGDEFAILQARATRERAADLAWRILTALVEPFVVSDHQIVANASIGIAIGGPDGRTVAEILKSADLALYGAKASGRGRYRFFTADLAEATSTRRALASDLKVAFDRGEFRLVFQPIVSLKSGSILGCEALLRWRNLARGEVLPEVFIPLAEDLGLISRIGSWVLNAACHEAARWPESVHLSVNISPLQLRNVEFAGEVQHIVAQHNLSPQRVMLEITESATLDNDPATRECLRDLKAAGFGLALDDFGTGYSSLKSLRAVAFDKIKIDKSFVSDFGQTEAATALVRAIVALARSLGTVTTAEGVETAEMAEMLIHEGCDEGQGFHFSRPLSAEAIYAYCLRAAAKGGKTPLAVSA